MKNKIIILLMLLVSLVSFSQVLRNDKYEMYLIEFEENEVSISKGMYMTDKAQSYYEGIIEVTFMGNGETKKYNFIFSTWNQGFKEFKIKDNKYNIIKPMITFKNKNIAIIHDVEEFKLEDTSNIENSILSSMVVWLDNQNK